MCGLLPALPFDLPSCPGLPDSLVPDQVTSSECTGDDEQVAHNSRGDFRQITRRTWLSLSLSKELPEGIPEGEQREMYEPWIWGRGSPAQGASHSPGTLVTMGTPDSPPDPRRNRIRKRKPRICSHPGDSDGLGDTLRSRFPHPARNSSPPYSASLPSPLHFLIYTIIHYSDGLCLPHILQSKLSVQTVEIYVRFAPRCIPNGQNRAWPLGDLGNYLLQWFELSLPAISYMDFCSGHPS